MDELIELVRAGDKLSCWRAINGLEGLLLQLAVERGQTASENEWLNAVLERLEEETWPDLAQLALDLGLSDTALRRRFKAATGQTMQEWVLNRRISAARELLTNSEVSLGVIATQLGYRNEYFFSRQFKASVGVAPGAFRRSRLQS
jgi:AraC-like DNA-binding protein